MKRVPPDIVTHKHVLVPHYCHIVELCDSVMAERQA